MIQRAPDLYKELEKMEKERILAKSGSDFSAMNPAKAGELEKHQEPCRILLVEDNEDDRFFGKRELEALESVKEVVCFCSGRELIDYMKAQGFEDHSVMCMTPTLIVIDLNMPEMDGFEVLKRLKSDSFLNMIPVIIVSGVPTQENLTRARALKANAFFRKPMNVNKLQTFFDSGWQWPPVDLWMH